MTPIKVMSFNLKVRGFEERLPYIRELLNKYPFDILCVQELENKQVEKFKAILPGYQMIGEPRGSIFSNELCAIFFNTKRFNLMDYETVWLSNKPNKKKSRFFLSVFPRICTYVKLMDIYNNEAVNVYNTHLDVNFEFIRSKQARKLKEEIKKHSIVRDLVLDNINILCGDFNSFLGTDPLRILTNSKVHLRPVIQEDNIYSRHEMLGVAEGKAIDHIFISNRLDIKSWKLLTDQIDGNWPSDHFPLYTELNLK